MLTAKLNGDTPVTDIKCLTLLEHIVNSWLQRKTVNVYHQIWPELIINPQTRQSLIGDVTAQLNSQIRNVMILHREARWCLGAKSSAWMSAPGEADFSTWQTITEEKAIEIAERALNKPHLPVPLIYIEARALVINLFPDAAVLGML